VVPLGRTSASLEGQASRHQTSTSLEDQAPRHRVSTSLEGLTSPRMNLRLTRGTRTPERDSASLEATLDPQRRTNSPDRSIKYHGMSRAPGSKANTCHAGSLTPPENHIPDPRCAAIPDVVRELCGKTRVIP
jgi:hypothetical protein